MNKSIETKLTKMTLLSIFLLLFQILFAEIAYTPFDHVEFGNTPWDRVLELSDGRYVSLSGKSSKIFTLSGANIGIEQTIYNNERYISVRKGAENTIYAITLYSTLDVYEYEPSGGLNLLSSLNLRSPKADVSQASVNLCFEVANGIIIYESYETAFNGNEWISRNIVSVQNSSNPVLLDRTQTEYNQGYNGFFFNNGSYTYIGNNGTIYMSDNPSAYPDSVAAVSQEQITIRFSAQIDNTTYFIYSNANTEYFIARLDLNNTTSINVTTLQATNIRQSFDMMLDNDDLICVSGKNNADVWQIERYSRLSPNDWQQQDVAVFDNALYKLFCTADGYFAAGFYQSMILKCSLNLVSIINESSSYLLYSVVMGRYLVLSESSSSTGTAGFRIFDLQTEELLDFYSTGFLEKNNIVHDANKLVFISQSIEVVEFDNNGIANLWIMPSPIGISQATVANDILALSGFIEGYWRIFIYSIGASGMVFRSQNIVPHVCANIGFYSPNHIQVNSYTTSGDNIISFYRVEEDYSLTYIHEIRTNGIGSLVAGNKIIQPHNDGVVIDISNPDQPSIIHEICLPSYGGWGGSFDGLGYFMVKDLFHSFILNSDFQVLGHLSGINTWFYQAGKFLNPGPTCVIKSRINALGNHNADLETMTYVSKISVYPNPFNPETTISFDLAVQSPVTIEVFNIKGQKVKTLVSNSYAPGHHSVVWNGSDAKGRTVSTGVYFYRMVTPTNTLNHKMLLMK